MVIQQRIITAKLRSNHRAQCKALLWLHQNVSHQIHSKLSCIKRILFKSCSSHRVRLALDHPQCSLRPVLPLDLSKVGAPALDLCFRRPTDHTYNQTLCPSHPTYSHLKRYSFTHCRGWGSDTTSSAQCRLFQIPATDSPTLQDQPDVQFLHYPSSFSADSTG